MTFAWHHPNYYKKLKRKATSRKRQAYQINYDDFCKGDEEEPQATSPKLQAPSYKPQASSIKLQAASVKHQVTSRKPQAPSLKLKAASGKRQDSSA